MNNTMALGLAVLFTGCYTPMSESFHTVGRGTFDTSEKRVVWGRALQQFQEHNAIVTLVDFDAGILASGVQPAGMVHCRGSGSACNSVEGWQFTMADDGTSLLSVRRGVTGMVAVGSPLLGGEDKRALEREAEAVLAAIVGVRGTVVQRSPPASNPVPNPLPVGARCSADARCVTGLCVEKRCAR